MTYPNNDNGDVLRRLEAQGDDLTRPRDLEFTLVFPDEDSAHAFSAHYRSLGYEATPRFAETVASLPWDVSVVKQMRPSYDEIVGFENELQRIAEEFGGRNDGWGVLCRAIMTLSMFPHHAAPRLRARPLAGIRIGNRVSHSTRN